MLTAVSLVATLKKDAHSNTATLNAFLQEYLEARGVAVETVRVVQEHIIPGTARDMGEGDAWPRQYERILRADILIFATPIWWGGHSSEMQKVVGRLDSVHDETMAGGASPLEGKVAGIVVTGDGDGAEHVIAHLAQFLLGIGIVVPPYGSLSVLSGMHAKGAETSEAQLRDMYKETAASSAERLAEMLVRYAHMLRAARGQAS